jgi:hypothetical protein
MPLLLPAIIHLLRSRAGPFRLKTAQELQHGVRPRIPIAVAVAAPLDVLELLHEHFCDLPRVRELAPIGESAHDACVRREQQALPPRLDRFLVLDVGVAVLAFAVLPACEQKAAHDVKHAQRERGLAVSGLQPCGGAEDLRARGDAAGLHVVEDAKAVLRTAEQRERDEERSEMRRVVSIHWGHNGRDDVTVRTVAVVELAVAVAVGLFELESGLLGSRAVLEELIVEGEELVFGLAEVDEGAPNKGCVVC